MSLRVNNLIGFSQNQQPQSPITARFIKRYPYTFSGTSATVTVAGADLGAQDSLKQILVMAFTEVPIISQVTIDGVRAGMVSSQSLVVYMFAAKYAGAGPFNIVLTSTATSTENGSIYVYEISGADDLTKSSVNMSAQAAVTSLTIPTRAPDKGIQMAMAYSATDTITWTWTNLTEISDNDMGDYSGTTAANTALLNGDTDNDWVVTASGSTSIFTMGIQINPQNQWKVVAVPQFPSGLTWVVSATASTTTYDFTGCGSFKLYALITAEFDATITGVTWGGNAMTLVGNIINTTASPDVMCYAFSIDVTQAAPSGAFVVTGSTIIANNRGFLVPYRVYRRGSDGAVQTTQGNATGAALTIPTVAAGGSILACHVRGTAAQTVTWTGVDEQTDSADGGSTAQHSFGHYNYAAVETNRTVQAVGSASGQYATLAFAINP